MRPAAVLPAAGPAGVKPARAKRVVSYSQLWGERKCTSPNMMDE